MRRSIAGALAGLVLFVRPLDGWAVQVTFDPADPETVGLSTPRLALATRALQAHIDAGDIAGVVAAVVRDGKLVYGEALGQGDMEAGSPMTFDALFRVYSMTRPVTALAIFMLRDDGLLDLHDPVQKYLPRFEDQPVLRDPQSGDVNDVRPRRGDVTIAHLLTHTSGIGSRSSALYRSHSVHGWDRSLEDVVDDVAALPLFEDPGNRFRYGMHSEVLGRVIEVVSGVPLADFFQERIFRPLGMTETVFHVDASREGRLATVYRRGSDGRLQPFEMETIPVTEPRALTSSGVGLVSSTMDFLRFSQLLLDGGVVDGRRLVSPEAVELMTTNGVSETLLPLGPTGYWAGSGWTLGGLAVVMDPSAYNHAVNRDELWWDGSAGTRFWIDPHEKLIAIVMAQVSPASGNGFRERFKTLVHDAIEVRRLP